jgi:hypothetical protein
MATNTHLWSSVCDTLFYLQHPVVVSALYSPTKKSSVVDELFVLFSSKQASYELFEWLTSRCDPSIIGSAHIDSFESMFSYLGSAIEIDFH